MDKVAYYAEKRPYMILLVVLAITGISFIGITRIETETSMEHFVPEGYESIETTMEVSEMTGGFNYENILIEGANVTTLQRAKILLQFKQNISSDPYLSKYIQNVETYLDYVGIYNTTTQELLPDSQIEPSIQASLNNSDVRQKTDGLITQSQDITQFKIRINGSKINSNQEEFLDKYESVVSTFEDEYLDQINITISLTGDYTQDQDINEVMNTDNMILIPAAIVLVIVILFITFRRITDTVLPFLVIAISAIWTMGYMGFAKIPFTMMMVTIIPLILGISIAYAIHMLNRYYELREEGLSAGKAVYETTTTTGTAVFLTALTTIVGFASFLISDLPPIQDMGTLCMLGVLFSFLLVVTLLPALIGIRDHHKEYKRKNKESS